MANNNKKDDSWEAFLRECDRKAELNRKKRRECTITGSVIGDSFLFDALMGRNNRCKNGHIVPYALNMGDAFSEYSGQACTGTWGAESKAGIAPDRACISFQKGAGRDFGCIPVCGIFMCNFVCTNFIKYVLPIIQMAKNRQKRIKS